MLEHVECSHKHEYHTSIITGDGMYVVSMRPFDIHWRVKKRSLPVLRQYYSELNRV